MAAQQPIITIAQNQPLIGIPFEENGKEVIHYFSEEAQADQATPDDATEKALQLAGAWSDLIAGEPKQQALRSLLQSPGIQAASVNSNAETLPEDPGRITIVVVYRSASL